MNISPEQFLKIYDTFNKMMSFMSDMDKTVYNNSQICNELVKRVEALEAKAEPEEMINLIEEYHYKDGELTKKIFIEPEPAPNHVVDSLLFALTKTAPKVKTDSEVTENRKIFCDGMSFVLSEMKDRDDAIAIFHRFMQMNEGEIA